MSRKEREWEIKRGWFSWTLVMCANKKVVLDFKLCEATSEIVNMDLNWLLSSRSPVGLWTYSHSFVFGIKICTFVPFFSHFVSGIILSMTMPIFITPFHWYPVSLRQISASFIHLLYFLGQYHLGFPCNRNSPLMTIISIRPALIMVNQNSTNVGSSIAPFHIPYVAYPRTHMNSREIHCYPHSTNITLANLNCLAPVWIFL